MCPRLMGYTNYQRSAPECTADRGTTMSQDTERIRVGEEAETGAAVELPVIDVLAGRGFITGKSGSGKSNTASVVAEQLLEAGYGLLIVDVDGEYYGLKEEYELLHAGADEECDIRVSPEHAEKLATLALAENVPIILDVSSYLDPADADEMLLSVARQLFAKAKKQKKPFLLLVEECHEYIPEGGGMTETGKMLIKIGKRGRKHGLGIVGMSQRPADVKKDFITQCDWMVWHRLTWDNDTRVVGRILGSEYADRVEGLNDGEAFLDTDWTDDLRRVQFDRKRTFDAGATPGLGEFERPDLQSVSTDLVADLKEVSEERERHESELDALEAELAAKEQRIEQLEADLAEARDMSEMADRFAQALVENTGAPETPGDARAKASLSDAGAGSPSADGSELLPEAQRDLHAYAVSDGGKRPESDAEAPEEEGDSHETDEAADNEAAADDSDADDDADGADSTDANDADDADAAEADDPADAQETTPDSDVNADGSPASSSGLQPVKTISSGSSSSGGSGGSGDSSGSDGSRSGELSDEAEDSSASAEPTTDPGAEDDETEEAVSRAEPTAERESPDTTLEAEPERWDRQAESTEDSESTESPEPAESATPGPEHETIEATGDWPTPDGERSAHATDVGESEQPADSERTAELARELSEDFGVTMEASSDLTGGSLGSSASDSSVREPESGSNDDEVEPAATTKTEAQTGTETDTEPAAGDRADAGKTDEPAEPAESGESSEPAESGGSSESDKTESEPNTSGGSPVDPTADRGQRLTELVEESEIRNEEAVVQVFVHGIEALDDVTREMLAQYRDGDELTPVDAHVAAGGSGERQYAYARNRTLRTAGVVEHVGGGRYRYRLSDLVSEVFDDNVEAEALSDAVSAIESAVGLSE